MPISEHSATAIHPTFSNPVELHNPNGQGNAVLLCEHASNFIPNIYNNLGLCDEDLHKHIAWDLGAKQTALILAELLDSPLVCAPYSRLLLDLNRDLHAFDSIVKTSENITIPGNRNLSEYERQQRHSLYAPFHDAAESLIALRLANKPRLMTVSIHSFTPVYNGFERPWHVGVLSQYDRRLADLILAELADDNDLNVGDNQPYAPKEGVYHSMQRHGEDHGLPCVMLEIRNDLIADSLGQRTWAERLAKLLSNAQQQLAYSP